MDNLVTKKNWFLFYIFSSICCLLIGFFDVNIQILIFFINTLICVFIFSQRGILHPLSWFPVFYFLYGSAFLIYEILDNNNLIYMNEIVPLVFIGFIGFLTPLIFFTKENKIPSVPKEYSKVIPYTWGIFLVLCVVLIIFVLGSGITSKREFIDDLGGIGFLFIVFSMLPLIYCVKILEDKKIELKNYMFIITLIILFIGFGVTGERDYIFRFFLFLFIMHYTFNKYNPLVFLGLIFILLFFMPLTQQMKGYLISESVVGYEYNFEIKNLFFNDFYAAGRNLYYVLEKQVPLMYGETFIWDVKRFFNFIFTDQKSTGAWFNDTFRVQYRDIGTSGWGFSLVAEAYINFGKFGIFLLYLIIGVVSGIFYNLSRKNLFLFLFYLLYIVVVIYVTRADFANYLSLIFKINVIIILTIFIVLKTLSILRKVNK